MTTHIPTHLKERVKAKELLSQSPRSQRVNKEEVIIMKYNGPEYEDDNDYYNDSNFADNEYLEDYLSSEARDEGVSFSDYEYNRRVDDYGWSSDDVDNGDDD